MGKGSPLSQEAGKKGKAFLVLGLRLMRFRKLQEVPGSVLGVGTVDAQTPLLLMMHDLDSLIPLSHGRN